MHLSQQDPYIHCNYNQCQVYQAHARPSSPLARPNSSQLVPSSSQLPLSSPQLVLARPVCSQPHVTAVIAIYRSPAVALNIKLPALLILVIDWSLKQKVFKWKWNSMIFSIIQSLINIHTALSVTDLFYFITSFYFVTAILLFEWFQSVVAPPPSPPPPPSSGKTEIISVTYEAFTEWVTYLKCANSYYGHIVYFSRNCIQNLSG